MSATVKSSVQSRLRARFRQTGFTMVEISVAIILMTLATAGVLAYFGSNTTAAHSNNLAGDLTTLTGRVKLGYANQYSTLTNANLSAAGYFKGLPALTDTAGSVALQLGGGTLVVSSGTVAVAGDSFQFLLGPLPDDSCRPLVASLAKTSTRFLVNTNVVKAVGAAPNPSQAICANDNNTMTITYQ